MVTIKNTDFTSNQSLAAILNVKTKVDMLKIIKKLDLYVSPNLKKDETARRVAQELLDNPISILSCLCKTELELLNEFIEAGPNAYVTRKIRKTEYKLQKFCLVLTNIDYVNDQWHMIMPDSVRESLAPSASAYLEMARKGAKGPTPKEFRMLDMLQRLYEEDAPE